MKTRREEQREATIQEIKDLAWQQMASNGPGNLSLRQISRDMRISSAAIFRYFANRECLLDALAEDAFLMQDTALETSIEANHHQLPAAQLMALAQAYRRWALAHPVQYMLVYGTPTPGYQPDWQRLIPAASRGLVLFLEIFETGRQSGHFFLPAAGLPPALETHLSRVITERAYAVSPQALYLGIATWARIHGMVSLELIGQLGLITGDPEIFFTQEINLLLAALAGQ